MCVILNLLGFMSFGILWTSCVRMSVLFPWLGDCPAIISSNKFFVPFALFSPFRTPVTQSVLLDVVL